MGVKGQFIDNGPTFVHALNNSNIPVALEAVGLQAEGYAKLVCPVDTGRLRNSISHAVEGNTAYIGTNVEYAPYVEFGTHKQRAQPYLQPAATEHGDEYKAIILHYLRNG